MTLPLLVLFSGCDEQPAVCDRVSGGEEPSIRIGFMAVKNRDSLSEWGTDALMTEEELTALWDTGSVWPTDPITGEFVYEPDPPPPDWVEGTQVAVVLVERAYQLTHVLRFATAGDTLVVEELATPYERGTETLYEPEFQLFRTPPLGVPVRCTLTTSPVDGGCG
jgi:hypothetical protein